MVVNRQDFVYPMLCNEAKFPLAEGGSFPTWVKWLLSIFGSVASEYLQMPLKRGCLIEIYLVDVADDQFR